MASKYTGPTFEAIRQNLTAIVTAGITPSSVAERKRSSALMELRLVSAARREVPSDASESQAERADMDALLSVLTGGVHKDWIRERPYRQTLRYILPLCEKLRGAKVTARRTAAGEHLFDDERVVKPSTIRASYEPKALDVLAVVLIEMEAEHRDEGRPAKLPTVDN